MSAPKAHRPWWLILAVSIGVLVAACGGGPSASPSDGVAPGVAAVVSWTEGQPTPDGCAVISAVDVSAASGYTIVSTMANRGAEPGCAYFDKDGLIMSTRFHQRSAWGQRHWDAEIKRGPVEIPGIGDEAIWLERAWQLWMWRGDTLVMMGVGKIGETPARLELAKKLAPVLAQRFE